MDMSSPLTWTNLSPSWVWPDPPTSRMASSDPSPSTSALRTEQSTSGLFDTGVAGGAELEAQPAEPLSTPSLDTIDTADLLDAFPLQNADNASLPQGGFDSLLQPGNCSSENLDLLSTIKSEQHALMSSNIAHDETAQGFHDDDGILGNTPDFLEQFTDLSSYSNDGTTTAPAFDLEQLINDMDASDKLQAASAELPPAGAIKRSASEAQLETDAEDDDAVFANPDHSDYTRKVAPVAVAKRRRRGESDADSVVSSTSSFGVVPSTSTMSTSSTSDQKYIERRRKNNIASRRSRETRKQKFVGMEKQAEELEAKNAALRVKVAELERLTKIMKDALVQQLAGAGKAAAQACAQSGAL